MATNSFWRDLSPTAPFNGRKLVVGIAASCVVLSLAELLSGHGIRAALTDDAVITALLGSAWIVGAKVMGPRRADIAKMHADLDRLIAARNAARNPERLPSASASRDGFNVN